jgi:cyclic pyranopterin monophosphate synthase
MVDVSPKDPTHRRAVARCSVRMLPETVNKIAANSMTKGDVLAVARVAGIQAAKQTSTLIPLCHPLMISAVAVHFDMGDDRIDVEVEVDCFDRTGVEMEAMTACAVAALTIYDMCKGVDRAIVIEALALWEKSGGKSGTFQRQSL